MEQNLNYDIDSIETLSFRDGVRQRIGMYLGSADMQGVYQAIQEIISNSIDEYYMGFGKHINIIINEEINQVSVEDEGRGVPFGIKENGDNVMANIFSVAHTGGKFNDKTYQSVAGLNGIGAKATCLSAKEFTAISTRDNKQAIIHFSKGNLDNYKEIEKNHAPTGTKITFIPDEEVYKDEPLKINFDHVCKMCKDLSYLTKGLLFTLINEKTNKKVEYCAENGVLDLINEETKSKAITQPFYISSTFDKTEIEIAFEWTKEDEKEYCFTNGLINIEGGTPVTGFKTSLTRNLNKVLDKDFSGDIVRSGLIFAISCKVPNPSFANQTKTKINNPELRGYADQACADIIKNISKKDLEIIKKYLEQEEKAANAAKKARETVRKIPMNKGGLKTILAGKLADCTEKDRSKCELILVEGNSAMGTVKAARNPKTQAVLPLRGKVLNVSKNEIDKWSKNQEILDIIQSIGVGYGNIDIEKRRYEKIIIATDADVDGSHIRILLLTLFMNLMPELIEKGHIYIALPPLYTISYKTEMYYALDDKELEEFNRTHPSGEKTICYLKGLGEMSAKSFSDTVLNENRRRLKQITMKDAAYASKMFEDLMGKEVEPRKEFLFANGAKANLDI